MNSGEEFQQPDGFFCRRGKGGAREESRGFIGSSLDGQLLVE
jgi:hypothetical protein